MPTADQRRHLLRARRRALALIGAVTLAAGLVGGCGSGSPTASEELGAAPGATSQPEREGDRFEMEGIDTGGPTTIPPGFFGPEEVEDIPGPFAPTSSTTTTTSVGPLTRPDAGAITSICGFEASVAPFERLGGATPAETPALMDGLVGAAERYEQVAEEDVRDDLAAIVVSFRELRDLLAQNGWDPASAPFVARVAEIRSQAAAGIPGSLPDRLALVVGAERRACS